MVVRRKKTSRDGGVDLKWWFDVKKLPETGESTLSTINQVSETFVFNEHNFVTNARAQYNVSTKEQNINHKEVEKLLDLKVII